MAIVSFTENWPDDGKLELTLDYSLEEVGIREGYFDYDETIYKQFDEGDIILFPFIKRNWQLILLTTALVSYYGPLMTWSYFVNYVSTVLL